VVWTSCGFSPIWIAFVKHTRMFGDFQLELQFFTTRHGDSLVVVFVVLHLFKLDAKPFSRLKYLLLTGGLVHLPNEEMSLISSILV
jgi:hypothetical protein